MEQPEAALRGDASRRWAWALAAAIVAASGVGLWLEGQRWWCAGGGAALWISDIWSSHNSQHVGDPYSLTHFSHGLIFYALLMLPGVRRLAFAWRLCIGTLIEAAWEVTENTDMVINRYRETTLALGYTGDTIANSLGDTGFFIAGFVVARLVGWRWALAIVAALELVLLAWIRDNLTLNVVMLLWPIEAIKQWQVPGS